jgi:hypothetical protein
MKIKRKYILQGLVKATGWDGKGLFGRFEKEATEEELEELKKEKFLVDCFNHGVKSIDYAEVRIIPKIEKTTKNGDLRVEYQYSQEYWERSGQLSDEEIKELDKIYFNLPIQHLI